MSRAVLFREYGGPQVLSLENVELAKPEPTEVLIKVRAIGLNRAEIAFREGKYLERNLQFPSRIGYEASGVVEAVGKDVKDLKPGDLVSTIPSFSMNRYGVYGDAAIVPASAVTTYPKNLNRAEATSIWMQYLTAYGALFEFGKLKSGDAVVITAGSSSVGCAAIELVKDAGALSIVTTRSVKKKSRLLELGADHVIVTDEENLVERVKEITHGKGASILFDAVAGPIVKLLAEVAAQEATIIEYGSLSMTTTPYPFMVALGKGLNILGYTLFLITKNEERLARAKDYVSKRLENGILKPVIAKQFQLEHIRDAHAYMESNEQIGKIVVTVDP